jgi:hypothetical protein
VLGSDLFMRHQHIALKNNVPEITLNPLDHTSLASPRRPFPSVGAYAFCTTLGAVSCWAANVQRDSKSTARSIALCLDCSSKEGKRRMTKLALFAAISGAFTLAFVAGNGATAPLSEGMTSTLVAAGATSLIEPTHGCHRSCRLGRVGRWGGAARFHRHVGPACRPVRC